MSPHDLQYLNENSRAVKEYHLSLPESKNKGSKMAGQNKFVYDNDQGSQVEFQKQNKPKNGKKIFHKFQ